MFVGYYPAIHLQLCIVLFTMDNKRSQTWWQVPFIYTVFSRFMAMLHSLSLYSISEKYILIAALKFICPVCLSSTQQPALCGWLIWWHLKMEEQQTYCRHHEVSQGFQLSRVLVVSMQYSRTVSWLTVQQVHLISCTRPQCRMSQNYVQ